MSTVLESMFEIEPLDRDGFLKVKETLTRIGLPGRNSDPNGKPVLWQSCHVFHRRGTFYICHFKQLFILDGRTKVTDFTDEDLDRLEYVVSLLHEWGLVHSRWETKKRDVNLVVLPYSKKGDWELRAKYNIGVKKS